MFNKFVLASCVFFSKICFADIYVPLNCEQYTAEESKALCESYEKERRELSDEISKLHTKLNNLKRELQKLSED